MQKDIEKDIKKNSIYYKRKWILKETIKIVLIELLNSKLSSNCKKIIIILLYSKTH